MKGIQVSICAFTPTVWQKIKELIFPSGNLKMIIKEGRKEIWMNGRIFFSFNTVFTLWWSFDCCHERCCFFLREEIAVVQNQAYDLDGVQFTLQQITVMRCTIYFDVQHNSSHELFSLNHLWRHSSMVAGIDLNIQPYECWVFWRPWDP